MVYICFVSHLFPVEIVFNSFKQNIQTLKNTVQNIAKSLNNQEVKLKFHIQTKITYDGGSETS